MCIYDLKSKRKVASREWHEASVTKVIVLIDIIFLRQVIPVDSAIASQVRMPRSMNTLMLGSRRLC